MSIFAQSMTVVMGGWNSCGHQPLKNEAGETTGYKRTPLLSDMHAKLFEKQAEGQVSISQSPYIVSCHDMGGNIYYVSSDDPNNVIELKKPPLENREDSFKDAIERMYNDKKDDGVRKLNLVGHSHGGWLAMTMAEGLDKEIPIENLYTIDPISKKLCNASDYGIIGDSAPDCLRYPRDFTAERIKAIKDKVKTWKNYWQDEDRKLHSSAIPGVDNTKMRLSHTGIDNSDFIWNGFNENVSEQGFNLTDCFKNIFSGVGDAITTLMLPGAHLLANHPEEGLTAKDGINAYTIERVNSHLARGEYDKVEEFIRANPDILEYEEFNILSALHLGNFFEQGHGNANNKPDVRRALTLYAGVMNRDLTNLSLEQTRDELAGRAQAINRIIEIFERTPENERRRDVRASIEYWRGKQGDNQEAIDTNNRAIRAAERAEQQKNNPQQENSFGKALKGIFGN